MLPADGECSMQQLFDALVLSSRKKHAGPADASSAGPALQTTTWLGFRTEVIERKQKHTHTHTHTEDMFYQIQKLVDICLVNEGYVCCMCVCVCPCLH